MALEPYVNRILSFSFILYLGYCFVLFLNYFLGSVSIITGDGRVIVVSL